MPNVASGSLIESAKLLLFSYEVLNSVVESSRASHLNDVNNFINRISKDQGTLDCFINDWGNIYKLIASAFNIVTNPECYQRLKENEGSPGLIQDLILITNSALEKIHQARTDILRLKSNQKDYYVKLRLITNHIATLHHIIAEFYERDLNLAASISWLEKSIAITEPGSESRIALQLSLARVYWLRNLDDFNNAPMNSTGNLRICCNAYDTVLQDTKHNDTSAKATKIRARAILLHFEIVMDCFEHFSCNYVSMYDIVDYIRIDLEALEPTCTIIDVLYQTITMRKDRVFEYMACMLGRIFIHMLHGNLESIDFKQTAKMLEDYKEDMLAEEYQLLLFTHGNLCVCFAKLQAMEAADNVRDISLADEFDATLPLLDAHIYARFAKGMADYRLCHQCLHLEPKQSKETDGSSTDDKTLDPCDLARCISIVVAESVKKYKQNILNNINIAINSYALCYAVPNAGTLYAACYRKAAQLCLYIIHQNNIVCFSKELLAIIEPLIAKPVEIHRATHIEDDDTPIVEMFERIKIDAGIGQGAIFQLRRMIAKDEGSECTDFILTEGLLIEELQAEVQGDSDDIASVTSDFAPPRTPKSYDLEPG